MTPTKEKKNFPVTDPKDMEIFNLSNKEFEVLKEKKKKPNKKILSSKAVLQN